MLVATCSPLCCRQFNKRASRSDHVDLRTPNDEKQTSSPTLSTRGARLSILVVRAAGYATPQRSRAGVVPPLPLLWEPVGDRPHPRHVEQQSFSRVLVGLVVSGQPLVVGAVYCCFLVRGGLGRGALLTRRMPFVHV